MKKNKILLKKKYQTEIKTLQQREKAVAESNTLRE